MRRHTVSNAWPIVPRLSRGSPRRIAWSHTVGIRSVLIRLLLTRRRESCITVRFDLRQDRGGKYQYA
uniref:Uncharacterized protein n=1 Tax=Candidatus Kentrum sp. TC TaxID=2126339 RepID=A0A451A3A7_9GAMM|nr:MAG: hypothetical protein BECKTC1821E_GA0114239_10783 [Candidatus Kentron sp. TC]VFK47453.1 MAG: hypothetical protein BECKTC1821D_GA0114238_104714 [Candidatus Kentron sp. TC]VFK60482.1 MAG: hypothetical protein BECKTC1821F_GA0114240_104615 [Candidatus Kentron sp. TC]